MTEEKAAPAKLHWPAWVWIVGHFLLFGYFLVTFIALLVNRVLFNFPVWGIISYSLLFFCYAPLCLISAIFMFINRRIAWLVALATLGASTLCFLVYVLSAALSGAVTWISILVIVLGVNVAWLVYFIKTRSRYGVISHD
jgi:hypothetical protein